MAIIFLIKCYTSSEFDVFFVYCVCWLRQTYTPYPQRWQRHQHNSGPISVFFYVRFCRHEISLDRLVMDIAFFPSQSLSLLSKLVAAHYFSQLLDLQVVSIISVPNAASSGFAHYSFHMRNLFILFHCPTFRRITDDRIKLIFVLTESSSIETNFF